MQPEVFQDRLSLARERRCPFQFVKDYFGLDLENDEYLLRAFTFWTRQRNGNGALPDGAVDRWLLELFLESRRLMPEKWAALQLGMTRESLQRLRAKIDVTGPVFSYFPSRAVVGSDFESDLLGAFRHENRLRQLN